MSALAHNPLCFNPLQLLDGSRPPSKGEGLAEGEGLADSEGEHADYCYTCKDGGELLCCDFCPLAYHLKCLVPPMAAIPNDDWRCPRCEADPLGGKVERIHTWRWKEIPLEPEGVVGSSELEDDAIAVEGAAEKKEETAKSYKIREFFVKWHGKSFWKNSWVSEIRVSDELCKSAISMSKFQCHVHNPVSSLMSTSPLPCVPMYGSTTWTRPL